jgi:hypothetical protein
MNMVLDDDFIKDSDKIKDYFMEETLDLAKELGLSSDLSEVLVPMSVPNGYLAAV